MTDSTEDVDYYDDEESTDAYCNCGCTKRLDQLEKHIRLLKKQIKGETFMDPGFNKYINTLCQKIDVFKVLLKTAENINRKHNRNKEITKDDWRAFESAIYHCYLLEL